MAYTKKTWVKGSTPLSAENFNHMEQGIADAHTEITQLNSEKIFLSKVFQATNNKMVYWQKCQSEIAAALEIQVSDIKNENLYVYACNGDWDACPCVVTGAAIQWDGTNLNINIRLSDDTNGSVRINLVIMYSQFH